MKDEADKTIHQSFTRGEWTQYSKSENVDTPAQHKERVAYWRSRLSKLNPIEGAVYKTEQGLTTTLSITVKKVYGNEVYEARITVATGQIEWPVGRKYD